MKKQLVKLYFFLLGFTNLIFMWVLYYVLRRHSTLRYKHLSRIQYFSPLIFKKIKKDIITNNIGTLSSKEEVKVLFCLYTASMWSLDGLYHKFVEEKKYKPTILVAPFAGIEPESSRIKTFEDTKQFLIDKNYDVVTPYDNNFNIKDYDIIFYTTPYDFSTPNVNVLELPIEKLICYISYSYMLSQRFEKLNLPAYQLSWLFFCDSDFYLNLVKTKSKIYTDNAVYCGFAKIDQYYQTNINRVSEKKIIIYAPHHSVSRDGIKSATFDQNAEMLFNIAQNNKDVFYWIIKPHPLLRYHSVLAGIFKDETGYDDYMSRWANSGFATVIEKGDYWDAFKMSDAMITDSVSFLAEYQFTGKPLLLLESGYQTYNDFGKSIVDVLYRCKGDDQSAIESFLDDINSGIDTMRGVRTRFFDEYLGYYEKFGKLAFENMFDIIDGYLK